MSAKEIDRLLVKIRGGDNAAFEQLYLRTKRGVYAFLYTYYNNPANTEDAMQSVYLRIKTNIGGYAPGTNGRAWILQLAKNYALTELRRAKRELISDEIDAPAPPFEKHGVMDIMERVLSDEERRIVTLHVLWKYKHREIAQMLDLPTGTVTSKYKRAIEKVKNAWKEE